MMRSGIKTLWGALLVLAGTNGSVWACAVCYGEAESPILDGARLSIIFMLVITYLIIGGFVRFFLYLRRREKLFTENTPELTVDKGRGV